MSREFGEGALCFSRGEQRFSVAEKKSTLIMRFSAGFERSRAKAPLLRNESLSRWTEVQPPLLKQGAPTRFGVVGCRIPTWFSKAGFQQQFVP